MDDGLTDSEWRIARLVACGLRNNEVARELGISPKTIEWNLTRVYRKLGVRSRTELTATLARASRTHEGRRER